MSRVGDTGNNTWENEEGKIKGQPIIEIKASRELMDTHIYLDKERFHIRRIKETPVMCKKFPSVRTCELFR